MVAINFQPQFAQAVSAGNKRQTIRKSTKARAGCVLQLYTGQRTKNCVKLMDALCTSVQGIILMKTLVQPSRNAAITGIFLEDFANADGFKTYAKMWKFFERRADADGLFHGKLIRW